jgi:hypothetical protein
MLRQQQKVLERAAVVLVCMAILSMVVDAQARFRALGRETFGNLEVVTMLDTAQNACYLLFVTEPGMRTGSAQDEQPYDVSGAAALRDQRLAELNDAYLQSFRTLTPGIAPVTELWYSWEAQKAISDFERVVRENELTWLASQIERAAAGPKLAVSGPAPCGAQPPAAVR